MTVPDGRGRWRVTLHNRQWTDEPWSKTLICELPARGRHLEKTINAPARFTFTLDGRSAEAAEIRELEMDVMFWRWSDADNADTCYFRGVIAQAEDQLTEQAHVTTFTCHDYLGMMARRYLTRWLDFAQSDQDDIVSYLRDWAVENNSSGGVDFAPGSYLPIRFRPVNADGSTRFTKSGELRDRHYTSQTEILKTITDLSAVISMADPTRNAFDFDVAPPSFMGWPGIDTYDMFQVFYPGQGVARTDVVLEYGGNISTVTRSANSADYANHVRIIGATASGAPEGAEPMFSETWNADANNVTVVPIGLWSRMDSASDVSIQATLDQKAAGDLNFSGVLIPSYALGLRPGVWRDGFVNMGDTVPVVIQSGRLDVSGAGVRIVGLAFDVGEDNDEKVSITVGRPVTTLASMLRAGMANVDALARR